MRSWQPVGFAGIAASASLKACRDRVCRAGVSTIELAETFYITDLARRRKDQYTFTLHLHQLASLNYERTYDCFGDGDSSRLVCDSGAMEAEAHWCSLRASLL